MSDELTVEDRIWLYGGYDMEPKWLGSEKGYFGRIICFISGQNDTPAAVAKLEKPITVDNLTGDVVVLELRYVDAEWKNQATVHIELCDFMPEPKKWQERRKGKWIESHATCEKV
jgi:hypothetical protein